MKIDFLAHASFMLTRADGTKILLDPYESNSFSGRVGYAAIEEEPDIVVITHDHKDHSHTETLGGNFQVIRHADNIDGLKVTSVPVFHDQEQGTRFGGVIDMKVLEFDGWRICHCGDIGETLDDAAKVAALQDLDILIIPVGGYYTVDAELAEIVTRKLAPTYVIPCHYKTMSCGFDIAPREPFLERFDRHIIHDDWRIEMQPAVKAGDTICLAMEMKYDTATEQVIGHYKPRVQAK